MKSHPRGSVILCIFLGLISLSKCVWGFCKFQLLVSKGYSNFTLKARWLSVKWFHPPTASTPVHTLVAPKSALWLRQPLGAPYPDVYPLTWHDWCCPGPVTPLPRSRTPSLVPVSLASLNLLFPSLIMLRLCWSLRFLLTKLTSSFV